MQSVIISTWKTFLWIFRLTASLTLIGILYLWISQYNSKPIHDLPYLYFLITTLIVEVASYIYSLAKYGFKYLPKIEVKKTPEDTIKFLNKFIKHASTVTIVSNRLSWVDADFIIKIKEQAQKGTKFTIIIPTEESNDNEKLSCLRNILNNNLLITGEKIPPEARFTLINEGRSGAEKLAIAKGTYPEHEITMFDSYSGPQIIGMAKDIIRKSKENANVPPME